MDKEGDLFSTIKGDQIRPEQLLQVSWEKMITYNYVEVINIEAGEEVFNRAFKRVQ